MARYIHQGIVRDQHGVVIASASVTVYLAGTTNLATIYSASSGGSAVTGSVVTTLQSGYYKFYIDDGDYLATQKYDIVTSKTDYQSLTFSDIVVVRS